MSMKPMWKGKNHKTRTVFGIYIDCIGHGLRKAEVMLRKMSSVHGIVRPPIGWLKPNSSSAMLSSCWNEGWFNTDTGITNLFFLPFPTYTAKCPLGTSTDVGAAWFARLDRRRMYFALKTQGKRIAITVVVLVRIWKWLLFFTIGLGEKCLAYGCVFIDESARKNQLRK